MEELSVAIIGSSRCSPQEAKTAEAVGAELARRGATLVCGGLGGVMRAACKGAQANGGRTVGILPGDSRRQANPYVDIPIVTAMGEARNAIIINSAQAVIAVGGEYGTLSEIAFALRRGLPVIGLGTWSLPGRGKKGRSIVEARDAVEAVELAVEAAKATRRTT